MKEGQLKSSNRSGCLMYLALIYAFPMLAALAVLPLGVVYLCFRAGEIGNGLFVLAVEAGAVYLFIKYKRKGKKEEAPKNPNTAVLRTEAGGVQLGNPFRGVFVLGAAGSGKSESIAVPLLSEFVRMGFAGVVYDFKFPTLAKDVQSFVNAKGSVLRHFYLDFNNPQRPQPAELKKPDFSGSVSDYYKRVRYEIMSATTSRECALTPKPMLNSI